MKKCRNIRGKKRKKKKFKNDITDRKKFLLFNDNSPTPLTSKKPRKSHKITNIDFIVPYANFLIL